MTRDQIRKRTLAENPGLSDELFREALVLNTVNHLLGEAMRQYQRATSLEYLADFLGMSKGEVTKHLQSITKKIEEAQMDADRAAIREVVEKYEPIRKAIEDEETTDNAASANSDAAADLSAAQGATPKTSDVGDVSMLVT